MFLRSFIITVLLFFIILPSVAEEVREIHDLRATSIVQEIEATQGTRRVLMIYASWCPVCRQKMPYVIDIERAYPGSVIAVSIDKSYRDLERYIKQLDNLPFKIIRSKNDQDALARRLQPFGVESWEYVPNIIFLDENNRAVEQGNLHVDYVRLFLSGK